MSFELATMPPAPGTARDVPVVQVRGEIDVTNADRLHEEISVMAAAGLVVDLSSVGYFDSAGFAVLDRLISRSPVAVVVPPRGVVRTAMSLLNLPFHDSVDGALASLTAGSR